MEQGYWVFVFQARIFKDQWVTLALDTVGRVLRWSPWTLSSDAVPMQKFSLAHGGGTQRFEAWEGFDKLCLASRREGPHTKECKWPLGTESTQILLPPLGDSQHGNGNLTHKETDACQKPERSRKWIPPQSLQISHQSQYLDFGCRTKTWPSLPTYRTWANKWVLSKATVVICYAATET